MSISCLIVDDEPLAGQLLAGHIAQTPFLTLVGTCYDALETLTYLKQHRADVLFLDINLPNLSGMQLKTLLPAGQNVVFTTAYSAYAVESYEQNAVDYLLKPITFERFLKTALKVRQLMDNGEATADAPALVDGSVFVKSGKELVNVAYDDIEYIEGLKDYVTVVTTHSRIITYKRLKDLALVLPGSFSRVHLSYIVNRRKIQRIADNQLWIGAARIPLSETYRAAFMQQIEQRLW